ncbi:hypothetical protein QFC21_000263 [Naganishia friedmannii]|uniref:Uncharacterized protein n=1 Tax=Naganishia friedmannii TaxID=89922 RepID=A0ACC2WDK0_9TREE|nr:hypothetical protein QFC21_000263 [Naganishia friedmannii]
MFSNTVMPLSRKHSDLLLPTTTAHDVQAGTYHQAQLGSVNWILHPYRRKHLRSVGIAGGILGCWLLLRQWNHTGLDNIWDHDITADYGLQQGLSGTGSNKDPFELDTDRLNPNPLRLSGSATNDWTAAGLVEGLVPLEDNDPNPSVHSLLGEEAENAYVHGSRTLQDYVDSLSTFIDVALPEGLSKDLRASLEQYADNTHPARYIKGNQERLPGLGEKAGTKNIWQTDAKSEHAQSAPVASWKDNGEGWQWRLLNDVDAARYVAKQLGNSRLKSVWDLLPSGILHSDMLRYLLLLLEGGIYSDTDTKRLKPISEWGSGARLWKGGRGWLHGNDSGVELGEELSGIGIDELGPPSVVIGIEADVGDREDWHDWWPRPVQIVQWTISSTPHHPIALDVLRQITHQTGKAIDWRSRQSQTVQELVKAGESERAEKINRASILSEPKEGGPVGVMDWTGPGVWTDAVLRYLRVKFGLRWTDLQNLQEPMRIGDVVILPVTGFSPGVGLFGAKSPWGE